MKVVAIDPGFGRCGIAVLNGHGSDIILLHSSCVTTASSLPFGERLETIADELLSLIDCYKPDTLAIEELYFSTNKKTALRVAEVRGMILYIAHAHGLHVVEYNPLAIKIALTGYGRASKEQVMKMVEKLIRLPKEGKTDDEFDAIAVGLTAIANEKTHAMR